MKIPICSWFILGVLICVSGHLLSQEIIDAVRDEDSILVIKIVSPTDSSIYRIADNGDQIQELYGNVVVLHDSIYFRSDTAIVTNGLQLNAGGNVVLTRADSLFAYADDLHYDAQIGKAKLESDEVILQNGDIKLQANEFLEFDMVQNIGYFERGGFIQNDSFQVESTRATYYLSSETIYLSDNVLLIQDSTLMTSDSLRFEQSTMRTYFVAPTRIQNGSDAIYCEDGYYDLTTKYALFSRNAQFRQGDMKGTADTIIYDAQQRKVFLQGNAVVIDSSNKAIGHKIVYDLDRDVVDVRGNASIENTDGILRSESFVYDLQSKRFRSNARTHIKSDGRQLYADTLSHDSSGITTAVGNVIWVDEESNNQLSTDRLNYQETNGYIHAYGMTRRPMLTFYSEQDTFYVIADTFVRREQPGLLVDTSLSEKNSDIVSTNEDVLIGFHRVRVLNQAFGASCDSIYYSTRDSTFRLLGNPILWSDSSQVWGDTIWMTMTDTEIDEVKVWPDARVMSYTVHTSFWNQIRGRRMDISFMQNKISTAKVSGNAESIYFIEDDESKFVGSNEVRCAEMLVFFNPKQQITKVLFLKNPDGNFKKVGAYSSGQQFRLDGIIDLSQNRPRLSGLDEERNY